MQAKFIIAAHFVAHGKTPAAMLLAFCLLLLPVQSFAQISCDNDGVPIEWKLKKGVVQLKDPKVRDVTGNNNDDRESLLANPGVQNGQGSPGLVTVNSLNLGNFPDEGLGFRTIEEEKKNVWTAEYPKGMYEFANKNDLILEIEVTVIGGQASHVIVGPTSTVSMSVEGAGIDAKFHGGNPKSLKQLRGDLDFAVYDLFQLSTAGIHRADINICVNVRGTL